MSAINNGFGPSVVSAGVAGWRSSTFPTPADRAGRTELSAPRSPREPDTRADLAPLYEARGRAWTDAAKTRQFDQSLGRLWARTGELKVRLERVKLYPPYPIDEAPRAQAIREFNGLAAEVRKLDVVMTAGGVSITSLAPNASTVEAEGAITALTQAESGLAARRADLAAASAAPGAETVEGRSLEIGSRLGESALGGIGRGSSDLLRQIG